MKIKIYCLLLILFAPLTWAFKDNPVINQAFSELQKSLPVAGKLIHIPFVDALASYGKAVRLKTYKDTAVPGDKALRVFVKRVGENRWGKGIYAPLVGAINKGDAILIAFWARVKKADKVLGYGDLTASVQASSEPYTSVARRHIQLSDSWALYVC